jgi:hypothetical protein
MMSYRSSNLMIAALAVTVMTACGSRNTPEPAAPSPEPALDESHGDEATGSPAKGEYTCRVTIGGEAQPDMTCTVSEGDLPDTLWFETVDGDVQIFGALSPLDADSFELAGDLMCPQGACDEPIDATFRQTSAGAYEARADTAEGEIVIELTP